MSEKKIRVYNQTDYPFGLSIDFGIEKTLVIQPKGYVPLTVDEIHSIHNTGRTFTDGFLKIMDDELVQELGLVEMAQKDLDESAIKKLFTLTPAKLKEKLIQYTNFHEIEKIVELAVKADLTFTKLQIIEDVFGINISDRIRDNNE